MLNLYRSTEEGCFGKQEAFERGCWINLINPSENELQTVAENLGVHPEFLRYPLDEEERSRIENEDGQILVLVDIPVEENGNGNSVLYSTLPLGIILTEEYIITVCLRENPILKEFSTGNIKGFFTFKKTRFLLQILFKIATYYLKYLKQINKKSDEMERELHKSMKNQELFTLLSLEKSLVYFTTSLRANELVLEKLLRLRTMKMYPEDEELLEDVIIENKQAMEMTHTYSSILSGMMDAFASVISNNLNMVMKFLTAITIIISLPTMVASFFGMNMDLPFKGYEHAFTLTVVISVFISTIAALYMAKRKLF